MILIAFILILLGMYLLFMSSENIDHRNQQVISNH